MTANGPKDALVQLAALLAALAGMVDAIGFLAFGHVFFASPDASATVLGANLPGSIDIALFAGAMLFSFVAGVTLMTLIANRATKFRRTLVLSGTALALALAYVALQIGISFAPAVLLAMAMGGAFCIFERDDPNLQEAMSPSAQIVGFGEALVGERYDTDRRLTGLHASFWLAFLLGGVAGTSAWFAIDAQSLALATGVAGVLTLWTLLIERELTPK